MSYTSQQTDIVIHGISFANNKRQTKTATVYERNTDIIRSKPDFGYVESCWIIKWSLISVPFNFERVTVNDVVK